MFGIPISPFGSTSESKFLTFYNGIFVHVKSFLFIGSKNNFVQNITNKVQTNKQLFKVNTRHSDVFVVNFEHMLDLFLVFPLFTLSMYILNSNN